MRQLWVGLVALSLVASVAACGSAKDAKPVGQSADQTILAGWRAAQTAYFIAEEEPTGPDANYAQLVENLLPPLLGRTQTLFASEASKHWLVRGPWALGSPRVESSQVNLATVISCEAGGDVVIDPRTGHPVGGVLGEPEMVGVKSTMREVAGRWLESDITTTAFPYNGGHGSCGASY
jgi:hypothetical protein